MMSDEPDLDREEADHVARPSALAALRGIRSERYSLERREYAMIQSARALGATWQQVATELGQHSPQAAQQRYRVLEKRIGPG